MPSVSSDIDGFGKFGECGPQQGCRTGRKTQAYVCLVTLVGGLQSALCR